MNDSPRQRSILVKRLAAARGFDACGIARLGPIPHGAYYIEWLTAGRAGNMGYLHRLKSSRLDPASLRSRPTHAIVVAMNYRQPEPLRESAGEPAGRVAMYAWGEDYHIILRERLDALLADIRTAMVQPFTARVCVDTSPIIEREIAAAAGIGWIGKNTMVLNQSIGSWFVLGEITLDLDLEPDTPAADHCGSCTRCLDACPTAAFPKAYQMDARRCISYLTIEYRGDIAPDLQRGMGDWLYGCDICQQVCPFNQELPATTEPRLMPRAGTRVELSAVRDWTDEDFTRLTAGSATARASLDMWRRNADAVESNTTNIRNPPGTIT